MPLKVDCDYVLDPVNPITWWRLYRKVRADAPDLLVLQWWVPYWTPCLTAISRWIKRHTTIPIVFICHNVMPHEGGGVLDRRLGMMVLRQGDALIVHSEQDRRWLHVLLPQAEVRKALIPTYAELADQRAPVGPSPETTAAHLGRELGLPTDRPILLFFGFVRPYKGLEYLVQALPLVLEKIDAHLLVVGEFWSSPEFYRRYASEFGVEQAITFVNRYVPNEELASYFDLADVVVLPYVSATQSAVVQLAFGFGKPVITTRVGGLHEVVRDGVNGLVVPAQDEVALANAIVRYFAEGLQERFERNVCEERRDNAFTWSALVGEIERLAAELGAR